MNILIADDAAFMRMYLKNMLESLGHKVIGEAETGKEAVKKYIDLKPDLVTLDITMPQGNGIVAAKMIKEYDPNAKIIMITAIGTEFHKDELHKYGVDYILQKPIKEEELKKAIEEITSK